MSRQNVRFFDGAELLPGTNYIDFFIETRAAPHDV